MVRLDRGAIAYSETYPDAGDDAEYLPRQRKHRGFFESLFGSSSDEEEDVADAPRQKDGGNQAQRLRGRGNSK